jgi:hypothetical protein
MTINLQEIAQEISWFPFSSKVVPIDYLKNKKRDQRIYLLITISENEAIAFNKAGKRIGHLTLEEIAEFNKANAQFKIKTDNETIAPDDSTIVGIGNYFDAGKEKEIKK